MKRSMTLAAVLAALAALALTGCNLDTPSFTYVGDPPPVVTTTPGAITVAQGTSVTVLPYLEHEEIEGSTSLAIGSARSDDPTIASVSSTTKRYALDDLNQQVEVAIVVFGVKPGTTMLRLYDGDTDKGTLRIDVVAQDP